MDASRPAQLLLRQSSPFTDAGDVCGEDRLWSLDFGCHPRQLRHPAVGSTCQIVILFRRSELVALTREGAKLTRTLATVAAVGLLAAALAACGGGGSTETVTVEKTIEAHAKDQGGLDPVMQERFDVADELERRAEQRLIEAETANREGREAESLSLSAAGEHLLRQAEKVIADIEKENAEP